MDVGDTCAQISASRSGGRRIWLCRAIGPWVEIRRVRVYVVVRTACPSQGPK